MGKSAAFLEKKKQTRKTNKSQTPNKGNKCEENVTASPLRRSDEAARAKTSLPTCGHPPF
jgi:hypothetical protein